MVTLHGSTDLVKKIGKWGGISIATVILLIVLFRGGVALYKFFFPTPPIPPTVEYGKLPAIIFPESITQGVTYTIDTVSGDLGSFPDRAAIHEITVLEPNLLNLEETREKATSVGFTNGETRITDTVYSWRERRDASTILTINIISHDFTIRSSFLTNTDIVNSSAILPEDQAKKLTTSFLDKMSLLPVDYDETKTTTQLLSIQNGRTFTATSLASTDVIRVDLFQKDLNKLPIYYENPNASSMNFIVSKQNQGQIVEANYHWQPINTQKSSTYPIKSVTEAFEELKKGKGYIGSYFGSSSEILIKNVVLGYYMSNQKQEYLMPIYIFEGKDGFVAYISAVKEDWIGTPATGTEE